MSVDPFITPATVAGNHQNPVTVDQLRIDDFSQMVVNDIVKRGYVRVLIDPDEGPYVEVTD